MAGFSGLIRVCRLRALHCSTGSTTLDFRVWGLELNSLGFRMLAFRVQSLGVQALEDVPENTNMLRLHLSLTTHACREAVATIRCEISFGVVNWQRAQTARSGILLFTKHSNTHAQKTKQASPFGPSRTTMDAKGRT